MRSLRNISTIFSTGILECNGVPSKFVSLEDPMHQKIMKALFTLILEKNESAFDVFVATIHNKKQNIMAKELTYENCFWNVVLSSVYFKNAEFLNQYLNYLNSVLKLDLPALLSEPYGKEMNTFLVDECIYFDEDIAEIDIDSLKVLMKYGVVFNRLEYGSLCQSFGLLNKKLCKVLGVTISDAYQFRCMTTLDSLIPREIKLSISNQLKGISSSSEKKGYEHSRC